MAMNDEGVVALTAGGHTFQQGARCRGPADYVGVRARLRPSRPAGWKQTYGAKQATDAAATSA